MAELTTEFLKPAQVAKAYNISLSTLHRLLREGTIPSVRFGPQTVRIRREDVEDYIARQLAGNHGQIKG
jgi:excisionase family DNA binding protein